MTIKEKYGWIETGLGQLCDVVRGGSPRPMGDPRYFADQGLAYFEPFFYQAMTEIGYYGYDFDKFGDLMKHAHNAEKPEFQFSAPLGPEYVYDYEFGKKVSEFIKHDAENFIFLYGENDPWSASAADPGENKKCLKNTEF